MPWALNLEIKNIQLNIVDNDHSALSQRLLNKIASSTYFHLVEVPASYEDGLQNIEVGSADIIMEIPRHMLFFAVVFNSWAVVSYRKNQ